MLSAQRSLSIVHLLSPAHFGGLESVVEALSVGQTTAGQHVCVAPVLLPTECFDHPFVERLSKRDVCVEPIVVHGRSYHAEWRQIRRVLTGRRADLVHCHGYRSDLIGGLVARSLGIAAVTTVHGFTGGGWRNRLYEQIQRRSFRHFDAVIAVSQSLKKDLTASGVKSGCIEVIPNAWSAVGPPASKEEARARLGLAQGVACVGWVGRMSPEKAPEVFVKAASRSSKTGATYCLVGDGASRAHCMRLAGTLADPRIFRWPGVVPSIDRYLRAFDAIVLTSWTEGTPMLLLEAMFAGVPIVTTDVGGIPDVLSNDEAIICSPGDVPAIRAGMDDILTNPESALARSEAARRRLDKDFAIAPWVARHSRLYRHAIAK